MIKCNATVIGTVTRPADIKTGRNGNTFVTFGLSVRVKDGKESRKIELSVASDGDDDVVLDLGQGARIKVEGVLSFKRFGDSTYYNLSADSVQTYVKEEDSISGTLQFRGKLGSKGITERQSKKGAFRTFDAYSSERIDEQQYSYIWVHFLDFSEAAPDWLGPRVGINAEGELGFQIYNDRISLNCRVESLTEWDRENKS